MADTPKLRLYNTLTRQKEVFQPEDAQNVRMYVCGPRFCSPKSGNRFSDKLQNHEKAGGPQ